MEALTATWLAGGDGSVLGWTMLHSLWQAGLVAAGLALVLRIVPSAMTRGGLPGTDRAAHVSGETLPTWPAT